MAEKAIISPNLSFLYFPFIKRHREIVIDCVGLHNQTPLLPFKKRMESRIMHKEQVEESAREESRIMREQEVEEGAEKTLSLPQTPPNLSEINLDNNRKEKRRREFVAVAENRIMSSNKRVCLDRVALLDQTPAVLESERKEEDIVQEEGAKKRVQRGSKEAEKKKAPPKKEASLSLPQAMPNHLRIYLQTMGVNISEVKLVTVKRVTKTDTTKRQDRFVIPYNQVLDHDFLTPEEKLQVLIGDGKGRQYDGGSTSSRSYIRQPLPFKLIEPCLDVRPLSLQVWDLMTSSLYVFIGGWGKVVQRKVNRIRENKIVQVWSFRLSGELHFAVTVV